MQHNLEEFKISNEVVDDLLTTLEIFKEKNLAKAAKCTKKGFQTVNILNFETPKEISFRILKEINKDLTLFHMHLIHYFNGGEQISHDHSATEDYSFILYLNDSDGNTVFENIGEITPKKGKLIFFKSDISHLGKPSFNEKKIAVGALKSVASITKKDIF